MVSFLPLRSHADCYRRGGLPLSSAATVDPSLFLSLAIAVGLSRIYMGAHFHLDDIGGCVVRVALVSGTWWLRKKLLKPSLPPQS